VIIIIILMMIIIIINIIILCGSSKHTKRCKIFGFVTLDITRKNFLYWILNVEIHLDTMDIGIPLNKEIKHLSN